MPNNERYINKTRTGAKCDMIPDTTLYVCPQSFGLIFGVSSGTMSKIAISNNPCHQCEAKKNDKTMKMNEAIIAAKDNMLPTLDVKGHVAPMILYAINNHKYASIIYFSLSSLILSFKSSIRSLSSDMRSSFSARAKSSDLMRSSSTAVSHDAFVVKW